MSASAVCVIYIVDSDVKFPTWSFIQIYPCCLRNLLSIRRPTAMSWNSSLI